MAWRPFSKSIHSLWDFFFYVYQCSIIVLGCYFGKLHISISAICVAQRSGGHLISVKGLCTTNLHTAAVTLGVALGRDV